MAIETPIAPITDSPKGSEAPAAPALKPTRARNEYPEAYDELEALEQKVTTQKEQKAAPAPKAESNGKGVGGPPKTGEKAIEKPAEPAKPAPEKPAEKAEKPADKPKESETPAGEPDPSAKFATAHDLRKEYRRIHKALEERDRELTEIRAKAEKAPINDAVREENKALKKRLDEVEGELRYVDYTKSAEFKEKFEKPYQDAYDDAVEEVKELRVNTPDGNSRPATAQDFQRILQAETQDVRALANELFGEAANDVLAARRRLIELNRTANRESKRYREQATERERQKALKQVEERENMERLWNKSVSDVAEKYPQYFGKVDGDDEYNKALEDGYKTVDRAHADGIPLEEKIARLAVARHKAAAFPAKVLQIKRLESRVKELEEVVRGYEESAPKGGHGGSEEGRVPQGGDDGSGFRSAEEELDALARQDTAD